MSGKKKLIDTDEFLRNLTAEQKFVVKTRDGSEVKLTLKEPHSIHIERANRSINRLADSSGKYIVANNLVRFACRICIDGIDPENVVPFLRQLPTMPPLAPVVLKCLDLLVVPREMVKIIENNIDERSLFKRER